MTEATTVTIETPLTNQQIAENTVKELSANELTKEVERLLNAVDSEKKTTALSRARESESGRKYTTFYSAVETFLKEKIKDDSVDIDDLKELAEELDIALTKAIKVTFTVNCEYEFNVPLDWSNDDITDGDFNINISSSLDDDAEETSEAIEVEDFEVEDND